MTGRLLFSAAGRRYHGQKTLFAVTATSTNTRKLTSDSKKKHKRAPNSHPEGIRKPGPEARGLALKASHAGQGGVQLGNAPWRWLPSLFVPSPRIKRSKGTVGLETSNSSLRALCTGSQKGKLHDPSRDLTIRASLLAFLKRGDRGCRWTVARDAGRGSASEKLRTGAAATKSCRGSVGNASHTCLAHLNLSFICCTVA